MNVLITRNFVISYFRCKIFENKAGGIIINGSNVPSVLHWCESHTKNMIQRVMNIPDLDKIQNDPTKIMEEIVNQEPPYSVRQVFPKTHKNWLNDKITRSQFLVRIITSASGCI